MPRSFSSVPKTVKVQYPAWGDDYILIRPRLTWGLATRAQKAGLSPEVFQAAREVAPDELEGYLVAHVDDEAVNRTKALSMILSWTFRYTEPDDPHYGEPVPVNAETIMDLEPDEFAFLMTAIDKTGDATEVPEQEGNTFSGPDQAADTGQPVPGESESPGDLGV